MRGSVRRNVGGVPAVREDGASWLIGVAVFDGFWDGDFAAVADVKYDVTDGRPAGLLFRYQDYSNYYLLECGSTVKLIRVRNGIRQMLASASVG